MDPVMYIASSRLEPSRRDRAEAIDDFYRTHGRPTFRMRLAGAAALWRRVRALGRAGRAEVAGFAPPAARVVR